MARERPSARGGYKGNKSALPRKTCAACGREMVWRRRWAHVWDEVRYCSDACRRGRRSRSPGEAP